MLNRDNMEHSKNKGRKPPSLWQMIFRKRLPLERETCWFILVSVLDIYLTHFILQYQGFTEGNPIALFFLYTWGSKGLVYFKCAMVTFIVLITQIIAIKKPATARWTLNLGTLVVTGALIYSLSLLLKNGAPFKSMCGKGGRGSRRAETVNRYHTD